MGVEIERKFLVKNDSWKDQAPEGRICRQGYMVSDRKRTVRVRIMGDQGYLTVKGATDGISRMEFEYEIDRSDAAYMLMLCETVVEKTRYLIEHQGMSWELDVFGGANTGLVMAEIELESENQPFSVPDWVGKEVSSDPRYYNANLARNPFCIGNG
ncbi:MAG: CYTH domain-containing protein [Verrucomicrobiota bacterium]|nr:CYTH domain-containing protein [Verrucomicrobiota bacterium]